MSENTTPVAEQKRKLKMTLESFTMVTPPRTRQGRKVLRLTFGCTNGFPNVNMDTDEEGEPTIENGFLRLSSRLNAANFGAFCTLITMALEQSPGWKRGIECFHTWKDGRQHETPQHVNDLVVGVDNQGLVYITILQAGRTSSKYVFGPTEWHNYKDENGNSLSQKEQNHIIAREYATSLRQAMNAAIAQDCMDNQSAKAGLPSPSLKPEGGFNQGGNNFNRNNGNGYQNNNGSNGFQKKPWNGGNNNGGNNNYQRKPWNNNGGGNNNYRNNNGGDNGGFQRKPWNGNNGNNGGFQKKPWNNNGNQGGNNYQKQDQGGGNSNQKPESDFEEIEF